MWGCGTLISFSSCDRNVRSQKTFTFVHGCTGEITVWSIRWLLAEAKAYRVFDAAKDQVVTTRDVIFDEKIPPTSNVPAVTDSTGFFNKLPQIEGATDQQDASADVDPSIDEKLNEEDTAINDESDSDNVDTYSHQQNQWNLAAARERRSSRSRSVISTIKM